jgi:hypothetical protein
MNVETGDLPRAGDVFVGRERELADLSAGLNQAASGRGSLFLLAGEPGIGKSRLADELATTARERGFLVLWGRCWEAGGAPPIGLGFKPSARTSERVTRTRLPTNSAKARATSRRCFQTSWRHSLTCGHPR